ncbi:MULTISPECIES: hypothetical protein [unclassified Pseudoclavibacter]|uniref:hypothetical protein n=1 Tax=unclassified Pseudoclavibacter TaxID=2615177 RepID=UPI001BA70BA3|nr:hypothetical protein [Pseudoclavibacter sp. Marseille-Q4354]MBS3177815.1 hypothetical protein [Pseudoclavibacter sp. Marseille-Q4354]
MKRTTAITSAAAITVTLLAMAALTVNARQQLPVSDAVTCTVTAKGAEDGAEQIKHLRIDTVDCGSFRVADPILIDVGTRADLYRSIETGQTYTFDTRGDRIEFLGLVPGIVAATPAG